MNEDQQSWHGRIEKALASLLNGDEPFTIDDVLRKADLFESTLRTEARKYAARIMGAVCRA